MRPPARRFLRGPNLRREVFQRDRGVCAECGKDTVAFEKQFEGIPGGPYLRSKALREMGIANSAALWHADHIVPVSEGGGECGIENLRTLCWRCHQTVTRELRQRNSKAEKRKRKLNRQREMRETRHEDA